MADRPIIGCDIDGVIYPFDVAARTLLHLDGVDVPMGDVAKRWNHIIEQVGMEQWNRVWNEHRQQVMDSAPPYPGAITALHRIEHIARVVFITHRPRDVAHVTMRWLAKYKLNPYMLLHVSGERKSQYAEQLDMLAFIEDRPDNIMDLLANSSCTIWVPVRGWNAEVHGSGYARVRQFEDWVRVADGIEEEVDRGTE